MNKRQMQELINQLSIDPIWGCYTRSALQIRWKEFSEKSAGIIYLDIDDMHGLNSKYTHAGTDQRIKDSIAHVRHDDIIASRWLNGDELIFILHSGNPLEFSKRLQDEFGNHGIHATFAYSYIILQSAEETINPLDELVQQSKNDNRKGIIIGA